MWDMVRLFAMIWVPNDTFFGDWDTPMEKETSTSGLIK